MQLFRIETATGIDIAGEIKHIRLKDVAISNSSGKERDLEDLIIQYPGLLNFGDFKLEDRANTDLLIVSRQPITSRRKRADVFAIHRDGSLVVIEVKRDALDERNRTEGIEFQAIRYAAASRKLTVEAIIKMFSEFLKTNATENDQDQPDEYWRRRAVNALCEHLADTDEELSEADLEGRINPKEKQKIYLVAADYEVDVVSACAWLREHDIDISCFRLRPYHIAEQIVLERERLIPPPELDDFMTDIFTTTSTTSTPSSSNRVRSPSNRPTRLVWLDDEENPINVTSWKALIEQVVKRALAGGLKTDDLPMRHCQEDESNDYMQSPVHFLQHNLYADLHGSAPTIKGWIREILRLIDNEDNLRVETQNGEILVF